jgi:nicotinate-nucleotide adenylyltransferase
MLTNKEKNLLFSIIAKETGLSKEDVISKIRKPDYADARRIFAVIIKCNFKSSLRDIGNILGGRDHATIISSIKKHDELYESNKKYIEKYNSINSKFLVNKLVSSKASHSIRELKQKKTKILHQLERDIVMIKRLSNKNSKKPSNVGLFIGSFNPIHNAHLIVANTVVNGYNFDEVWFLFSDEGYALNHKGEELLSLKNRILLLKNAILDNPYFKLAKLDYKNDENNSVAESLLKISSKYKDYKFSLIMGADYLYDIDSLKSSKYIENNFPIFYYERGGAYMSNINKVVRVESVDRNIKKIEGLLETNISSSKVRRILIEENGIDKLKYIVPEACLNVLEQKGFYKTNKLKKITNE